MASSHPRRHVLWIDATANLPRTSSTEGLRSLLGRAREAGFTTVVVDVKPTSGEVLYPSRLAPVLRQWRSGVSLPAGYDLLGTAVELAYREALELFASVNVFCEGAVHEGRLRGLLAGDPARAGWEVVAYREGRLDRLTRFAGEHWAFVDPANPEVQAYELGILREILAAYPVAGIVLDRARYPGIVADFGEHTRRRLEALVGRAVARWPEDVYEEADPGAASGGEGAAAHEEGSGAVRTTDGRWIRPGPWYGAWLQLRAQVIREWMEAARRTVSGTRPGALLGAYAGSWYPVYHEVGVNWASAALASALEHVVPDVRPLIPRGYPATGYAEILDLFFSGNYYPQVYRHEAEGAEWKSVEGAARLVDAVTGRVRPTYAGIYLEQYRGRPRRAQEAIRVCREASDGVMVFDASHVEEWGWWDAIGEALRL
ncbi:alpha amylase family protein [Carboxydochorda subterranea]|uniref:Alpha amylase family protein n=1 Tax=Carboxydichorda subterranea TaxID=3109565 RepID=A0ABZ1BY18_9FIRM|nr:alpha amylase family protein [Limnochorda sp. L945t]WRP17586.1 alpha amylase family protein [Limnochorda sp. L945t]